MKYILICLMISLMAQCGELRITNSVSTPPDANTKQTIKNMESKNDSMFECSSDIPGEKHLHQAYEFTNDLEFNKAIPEFECAFEKGVGSFNNRIDYIRTLYILKRYNDVIEQCYVLLGKGENELVVHKFLADSLIETQRYEEALKEIEIARTLDSNNRDSVNYLYQIAIALDGLGKSSEALEAYEKYMEKARDNEPRNNRVDYAKKRILELRQQLKNNQT